MYLKPFYQLLRSLFFLNLPGVIIYRPLRHLAILNTPTFLKDSGIREGIALYLKHVHPFFLS